MNITKINNDTDLLQQKRELSNIEIEGIKFLLAKHISDYDGSSLIDSLEYIDSNLVYSQKTLHLMNDLEIQEYLFINGLFIIQNNKEDIFVTEELSNTGQVNVYRLSII